MNINDQITIHLDEELQYILNLMKQAYPALKGEELIKMATSGYFTLKRKDFEYVEFLSDEDSKSLEEAKAEIVDENTPTFTNGADLIEFLKK